MITPKQIAGGVYRGPQPKTLDDWHLLMNLGIKYTLDLETGSHLLCDGSPLEEAITAEKYGIKVFSHPLGEFLPPSYAELELAAETIDKFKPIYVHCKAGVDRTGMVIAHYEINDGFSKLQAISRMFDFGMHFWYYWWCLFL